MKTAMLAAAALLAGAGSEPPRPVKPRARKLYMTDEAFAKRKKRNLAQKRARKITRRNSK